MAISKTSFSTSDAVEFSAVVARGVITDEVGVGTDNEPRSPDVALATVKARTKPGRPKTALGSDKLETKIKKGRPVESKADMVLKKLRLAKGATLDQLIDATGWQAHSVRGFLSGTVKKKLGLELSSEVGKDGARRYRIVDIASVS